MIRRIAKHGVGILLTALLGGLLSATLVRFAPGFGVDEEELDARLNADSVAALRQARASQANLGKFYLTYLVRLAHGDLGVSRTLNQPIAGLLARRLPVTLRSLAMGLLLAWSLGLAFAVTASMLRVWQVDLLATALAGSFLCIPAAVVALFSVVLNLPSWFAIGIVVFPKVFRYTRNVLAKAFAMPHVLAARAKGLRPVRILFWHVLPISLPQTLALAAVSVNLALSAAIPIEALCDVPGVGQLAWQAALGRDLVLLVNLTVVVALVTLITNSASVMLESSGGANAA